MLGKAWPRALSFHELLKLTRLELYAEDESREQEDDAETLAEAMYNLACNDAISFSLYPRGPAASTTDKAARKLVGAQAVRN